MRIKNSSLRVLMFSVLMLTLHGCLMLGCATRTPRRISDSSSPNSTAERDNLKIQSPTSVPHDWKKIDLDFITFHIPPEMKFEEMRGTDSSVWTYVDRDTDTELIIDLGMYSEKPSIYAEMPEYREEFVTIDGKKATTCSFRLVDNNNTLGKQYASAVYFSEIDTTGTKLSFFVRSKSITKQAQAKTIFNSIKFHH
jgi:hypothetical protein